MQPEKEVTQCYEQMNIVEKYETVIAYLYPIAQNIPRKHGVAKAMFIECLLEQVNTAVANMPGAEGDSARIEWEYAHEVRRDSPLVAALPATFGWTSAQLDDLFVLAKKS